MNYAIILAGGKGVRFNSVNVPKQFVELTGMPMLVYSMKTAQMNANIDEICVVSLEEYIPKIWEWAEKYCITKLKYVAKSGKERFDSVYSGVCQIPADEDTVMIMTSVCPLLSQETIDKHYLNIQKYDGVITVVKATDAITFSDDGIRANSTLQKKKLFVQQGPQTYKYNVLRKAHELYRNSDKKKEVYEDSELVLDLGIPVVMVQGDRFCIKVTYPEDLAIARALYPLFCEKEKKWEAMGTVDEKEI